MYLIDTNIFLEILLSQENSEQAKLFLNQQVNKKGIYTTDFSVFSIGLFLFRKSLFSEYDNFLFDVFVKGAIKIYRIPTFELKKVSENAKNMNLDFDDAYQYTSAQLLKATIVSFDSDFDRTPLGRKTPHQILTS